MKMYKKPNHAKTRLSVNKSEQGESIEQKMERILSNKERIKDGAPLIYTERKEGVRASHNIRTDRFEVALDGTTKIAKSYKARREERGKAPEGSKDPKDGKPESTQGKGVPPTDIVK